MKTKILFIPLFVLLMTGCAELMSILESSTTGSASLTQEEVARGLKEALNTGANNASAILSAENGYFGDELVKILLPPEANTILENLSKLPGGQQLVDDVVLRINRSAEDAAKEVAPIFINSIRQMTIGDAFSILKGENDAATEYLRKTSYQQLYNLYKPKIAASTSKEIVAGISTKESWDALTGKWNKVANSIPGKIAGLTPVETDLDDYLTRRALDGVFLKVADEELKIRTQVSSRVTPLLQKVFGSLDNK